MQILEWAYQDLLTHPPKKAVGILIGIAFNLQVNLERTDTFTILNP